MSRRDTEEWFWLLGNELQRLSEEMQRSRPAVASGRSWEPRVDLIEEEHRFLIKAEVAGVRGEDIQLLYVAERHSILLRGHRPESDHSDGRRTGIHQLEILYGDFQREIKLPTGSIDPSAIRASYRNGILIVMVPKLDPIFVSHSVSFREI
jgi:HSP20 family protein